MCVQLDGVRHSAVPSQAMLLSHWLAGSVICILSAVDRVSFVVWHVHVESTHLDHATSADLLRTDLTGLLGDTLGRCATQDCVILLGDINDELLVTNACTFLVNDVVSLDPLGPV